MSDFWSQFLPNSARTRNGTAEKPSVSVREKLAQLLALVDKKDHPNINELWLLAKDIDAIKLNIKAFGYELAHKMAAALPPPSPDTKPTHIGLRSKPTTQADLETDWARHWCGQLHIARIFHRKVWEYAFVLQALYEADVLRAGASAVGFGCANEPLPSYFASLGINVLATDLPPSEAVAKGWAPAGQDTFDRETFYRPHLVSRDAFDRCVKARAVDMRNIPSDIASNDFCWSICSFEHLGSIEAGIEFIVRVMDTLRPGGVAVHTTEYNYIENGRTIDDWATVLFQKRHFEEMARRLTSLGHVVAPLDFDVGAKPLDRFIDVPPYQADGQPAVRLEQWKGLWQVGHLKLNIDGFPCTCYGLIVRKKEV